MTTAIFDTLKASRKLKAAGIDEAHAEAIVQSMAEAFDDTVATKADIAELKASTKADVTLLKSDLKAEMGSVRAEIANLRAEVFRALWIQGAGIVALIVGLTKLL